MTVEMSQDIKEKKEKERQQLVSLIRIHSTDIPGENNLYSGLARIKGISFTMSNAICHILSIKRNKKIKDLTKDEIKKIEEVIKNPQIPDYLKNRRSDFESGESKHLSTAELDLQKEFDIKRFKKIRSYKGMRHARGLPVRGQRTRSHFRRRGKNRVVGVIKKKEVKVK